MRRCTRAPQIAFRDNSLFRADRSANLALLLGQCAETREGVPHFDSETPSRQFCGFPFQCMKQAKRLSGHQLYKNDSPHKTRKPRFLPVTSSTHKKPNSRV